MMCYRDMTFCPYWQGCAKAKDCHRPLTDEVQAAAEKWWGGDDPPIAVFAQKPECYEQYCLFGCIVVEGKLQGDCRMPESGECFLNRVE